MSAEEQLALMRQAAKDRRDDLRIIDEDHTSSMAAKILILNQMNLSNKLLAVDGNEQVDAPVENQESFSSTPQEPEAVS